MLSKGFGKAAAISFINQVVTSGTNFGTVLYLVRVMRKADFGTYSLGFAIVLLLSGLISSFVAVQYVVNLPDQPKSERARYALHHAHSVGLLGLALLAVAALVAITPVTIAPGLATTKDIILVVALAASLFSIREFLTRVAYSEKREECVLYSSAVLAIVVVIGYFSLHGKNVTPTEGLGVLAVSNALSAIFLALMLKLPLNKTSYLGIVEAFSHSWQGGKWNILATAFKRVQSQSHNIVVAPLIGMAAIAEMNAARVLITPAIMMVPPLTQVILPRLADQRKRSKNIDSGWAANVFTVVSIIYVVFLFVLSPWIIPFALGETYQDVGRLVLAWSAFAILFAFKSGLVIALQAWRDFKALMWRELLLATLTILLCLGLAKLHGQEGALLGIVLAELAAVLIIFLRVKFMASNMNNL